MIIGLTFVALDGLADSAYQLTAAFDFEWIVIAMAFIAFVRWIIERVTGKDLGNLESDEGESTIVEDEDVERRREEAYKRQVGEGQARGSGDTGAEIRKFFEALGGQVTEAPPPVEHSIEPDRRVPVQKATLRPKTASIPPPLPPSLSPLRGQTPRLSEEEGDALARLRESQAYDLPIASGGRQRSMLQSEVRGLLSRPDGLRSAVLLQEILGPPRSLQSIEESHRF